MSVSWLMLLSIGIAAVTIEQFVHLRRPDFVSKKARPPLSDLTHVDYSARIQTVHENTNPRYHALDSTFECKTGCPVIVNTSFNLGGEPIVCTPEDAFRCFMGNELNVLPVSNRYLRKDDQDFSLNQTYESAFELD